LPAILFLSLVLRFVGITRQSFWIDELISVLSISVGFDSLFNELYSGVNLLPPVFDYALKLWTVIFGQSQLAIRAFSAVLGTALVFVSYKTARLFLERRTAWLTALMVAISPYGLYYSQEARCYMLLAVLLTTAIYCLVRTLNEGGRRYYLAWLAFNILSFYTHIYAVLGFAAQAAFVFLRRPVGNYPRKPCIKLIAGFSVIGLACVPWLLFTLNVLMGHFDGTKALGGDSFLGSLAYGFYSITYGFSLGPSLEELRYLKSLKEVFSEYGIITVTASLSAGIIFVAGWVRLRAMRDARAFIALQLFVPLVMALGMLVLTPLSFRSRYIVMAFPFIAVFYSLGIQQMWEKAFGKIVVAVFIFLIGLSVANYYSEPKYWREDYRGTVEEVSTNKRLTVFAGSHQKWALEKLLPGVSVVGLTTSSLEKLKAGTSAWVVLNRPWAFDPNGEIERKLKAEFVVEREKQLPGFRILQVAKRH
jgi:4-amino-4-deoxy-L-arabinose transferase-like glycosyltransferase